MRGSDSEDGTSWTAHVEGILLFSRPLDGDRARAGGDDGRGAARAPLGPPPFHLEILDWEAVAAWVAPHRYGPAAHARRRCRTCRAPGTS